MKRRFVLRFKRGKQFLDLNRKVWKIVENEKIPWNGTNECVETTLWHLYHFSQIGGSKVFFQSDEQYEKVELFRFYKNMQMFFKEFPDERSVSATGFLFNYRVIITKFKGQEDRSFGRK